MSDPLAEWWVHEVVLERYKQRGAYETGDEFDEPVVLPGFVADGLKLMIGPTGEQVASTARVALPSSVGYIPANSRVTLPAEFGNRVCTVVACSVADGGGQPTPDHVEIGLL